MKTNKTYTVYMKVEDVLRYMKRKALALKQFKIGDFKNHFFLAADVASKMTPVEFRKMECDVVQYWIEDPKGTRDLDKEDDEDWNMLLRSGALKQV